MKISLTFDNGPTPSITDPVLDVLDKRDIKATFFVLGKNLQDQTGRDLVIRAQNAGHLVGNHTFTHTVQFGLSDSVDEVMISELVHHMGNWFALKK